MRSARPALLGAAAIGALLIAGCSGSGHRGDPAAAGSTPARPAALASSTAAPPTTAGPARTTAATPGAAVGPVSAAPTAAPYPTPGRDPAKQLNQKPVLDSLPGSASSACALVGTRGDVRSGSIAMGDFAAARASFAAQFGKVYVPQLDVQVIPENATAMRTVTVTVDPSGPGATHTATSKSVQDADAWSYFALTLPVAQPGTYRLTVVSGTNRGCFEVTFRE
jgi:hypothetical protein